MKRKVKILLLLIVFIVLSIIFGKSKSYASVATTVPSEFSTGFPDQEHIVVDSPYPYGIFCAEKGAAIAWQIVAENDQSIVMRTANGKYQTSMDWKSETSSGELPPMVGYGFYLADKMGVLPAAYTSAGGYHEQLQSVIWSAKALYGENVAIKGCGPGSGEIVNGALEYAEVYYKILQYINSNTKAGNLLVTMPADGNNEPKVYVDQTTGKYTVGPYITKINPYIKEKNPGSIATTVYPNEYEINEMDDNTDYSAQQGKTVRVSSDFEKAVQNLYNVLVNSQNYVAPYAMFDISKDIENINGTDIEFVDKDGNKINFPNFMINQEKEYYIRFKPANGGAITDMSSIHDDGSFAKNPNYKVTYLDKFYDQWARYYCQAIQINGNGIDGLQPSNLQVLLNYLNQHSNVFSYSISRNDNGYRYYAPTYTCYLTVTINFQGTLACGGTSVKSEHDPKPVTLYAHFVAYNVGGTYDPEELSHPEEVKDDKGKVIGHKKVIDGYRDRWSVNSVSSNTRWLYTGMSGNNDFSYTCEEKSYIKDDTQRQTVERIGGSGVGGSVSAHASTTTDYIKNARINMELQGKVWVDQKDETKENKCNGVMDDSDVVFPGIQVSLYEYQGLDGVRTANDKLIATTTTDSNGKYWFYGRKPGTKEPLMNPLKQYYVQFKYNGQLYQDTYYKNDLSTDGKHSNAQETENDRNSLNARFKQINSANDSYTGLAGTNKAFAYDSSVGLSFSDYWQAFIQNATYTKSEVQEPSIDDYFKVYDRQKSYEDVYNITNETQGSEEQQAEQYIKDCMIDSYTGSQGDRTSRYPSYNKFVIIDLDKNSNAYNTELQKAFYSIGTDDFHFLYNKNWDQSRNVNFGLFARQQSDLAIQKDVYEATVMVNGQKQTYKYNKKDAKLDEAGDKIWTVDLRASDVLYNGETIYNREVRSSDYLYTADDELGNPTNYESPKNLQIYVTYRIGVRNLGSVDTKVDEITDFYDADAYEFDGELSGNQYTIKKRTDHENNNQEYVQSYLGNRKGEQINGNLQVYNCSQTGIGNNTNQIKTIEKTGAKYNSIYITGFTDETGNEWLEPGKIGFVYVTFKVQNDPVTQKPKLDEALTKVNGQAQFTVGKRNISEINSYETKYTKGQTLPNRIDENGNLIDDNVEGKDAGIVDFNSCAGNLLAEDLTDEGRLNYEKADGKQLFNYGTLKYEDNLTVQYKYVENDTDQAPNIRIIIGNEDEIREMSGYVFEDNRTETVEKSMLGNGVDDNEIKIDGVTIKLVELVQNVDDDGMSLGTYFKEKEIIPQRYDNTAHLSGYVTDRYYSGYGSSRQMYTTTDPNSIFYIGSTSIGQGEYTLRSLPAGNYYILFKYGDTDDTVLIKGTNDVTTLIGKGKNDKSYNGQDYKSTIYQAGVDQKSIEAYREIKGFTDAENQDYDYANISNKSTNTDLDKSKMYLYDIVKAGGKQGISDAKDSYYRRQANIDYASTLKNHNSEVLASFEKLGQIKEGENQTEFQRALVDELEKETYMEARTGVIDTEVEYNRKQSGTNNASNEKIFSGNDENKTTSYKITDIDLGLQQRPLAQLMLDKRVTGISVVLANGQTLFNTSQSVSNLYYAEHHGHKYFTINNTGDLRLFNVAVSANSRNTPELIQAYMDDELMEGSRLIVHYKLAVKNVGEVDYKDKDFYYKGTEGNVNANVVTTDPNVVIDYLTNAAKYDQTLQEDGVTWLTATQDDLVPSQELLAKNNIINRKYYDTLGTYNAILFTQGLSKGLTPVCFGGTSESTTTLITSADMSMNSAGDNLVYNNLSEIVVIKNTVGRRMQFSIVGNQEMADQSLGDNAGEDVLSSIDLVTPSEVDADSAQKIVFMPPTGANKNYLPMIIATIIAMGFVIAGTIVIRKRK